MRFLTVERNAASEAFFDAAARGVLVLRECANCGKRRAPRRTTCRGCGRGDASWVEASGRAELVTWARHPGDGESDGWTFGMVQLEEGPWLEATLVELNPEELRVGLPLRVRFVSGEGGDAYPVFGPAGGSEVRP